MSLSDQLFGVYVYAEQGEGNIVPSDSEVLVGNSLMLNEGNLCVREIIDGAQIFRIDEDGELLEDESFLVKVTEREVPIKVYGRKIVNYRVCIARSLRS
jgi:hypothetical protein